MSHGTASLVSSAGGQEGFELLRLPAPRVKAGFLKALVFLFFGLPALATQAQTELCRRLVQSLNGADIASVGNALHPNVVLTSVTGEVCRGKTETLAYLERALNGPEPMLRSLEVLLDGEIEWSRLDENAWFGVGRTQEKVRLANGVRFQTATSWSCLLLEENGTFLLAGIHLSNNPFRHPVLHKAKTTAAWASIVAGIIGLALGLFMGWLWGKSRKRTA